MRPRPCASASGSAGQGGIKPFAAANAFTPRQQPCTTVPPCSPGGNHTADTEERTTNAMALTIIENEPLAKYTSWRIGGPARFFTSVLSPEEAREALEWARARELPIHVLGGATNVLVRDRGFAGLVLRYRAQDVRVEPHDDRALARCAAGAPMAGTARRLAGQGWA